MAVSTSKDDNHQEETYEYDIYQLDEDDIARYEITNCDKRWHKYKTFKGLLKNMALFIQGKIPDTPCHLGELLDNDPEYISRLLKLNSMNILTNSGQEYKHSITKNSIYMQREYLDFAYKPSKKQDARGVAKQLSDILDALNKANVYYYAVSYDDCQVFQSPELGRIDFDNPEFWVTRTLNRYTKEYQNHTHISEPCDIIESYIYFNHFAKDIYTGTVFFEVWSKTWDEVDGYLMDEVIKCFS
jgi:hypothetical protein